MNTQPPTATQTTPGPAVLAQQIFSKAAVAADHRLASQAGLEILQRGGNAVDAAVATSFALSVVRPYSCGIGGGGFMIVHLKSHPRVTPRTAAINYRESAGAHAHERMFENVADPDAATHGGKAVCVPGHVAGMLHALEGYGTMTRAQVLAPAIRLAEEGYAADAHFVESSQEVIDWIKAAPAREKRFPYLWSRLLYEGRVKVGDKIHLHEQAQVLRLIVEHGRDGFYAGPVAQAICDAVQVDGGTMTLEDLAAYRVQEVSPFVTGFMGRTVISMPPPSSGGIVTAQVLGMLEARRADLHRIVKEQGHNSAAYVHLVTECFKHAFADRARWMGDPNFVRVPLAELTSPEYIRARANSIDLTRTQPPEAYGTNEPFPDDHGTSHLCVIDELGNAVACTETINLVFGSLTPVAPYGFILNNEMDDFLSRQGKANAFGLAHGSLNRPQAGKRPLSSMTPTLVLDSEVGHPAGPVQLLAGASGGPRIISGTIQAVLNVLVFDMPATRAVGLPRFHHQWSPDVLQLEKGLHGTALEASLQAFNHQTGPRDPVGAVQVIRRVPEGLQPASDPRKGGVPAGY